SFGEFLLDGRVPAATFHFADVRPRERLQPEMSLADENGSGHAPVHGTQKSERSGGQLEITRVHIENEFLADVRIAQRDVAQLAIDGVRICKRETLVGDVDADLLLGDGQFQLEVRRAVEIDCSSQRLKSFLNDAYRVFSRLQIGRRKLSRLIRDKKNRLREVLAGDFDPRTRNDRIGRIVDRAGNRVCAQIRGERGAKQNQSKALPQSTT